MQRDKDSVLGAYGLHTAHLSWDEDMAYTRLLRLYFSYPGGVQMSEAQALARAATPQQCAAVQKVLALFFRETPAGLMMLRHPTAQDAPTPELPRVTHSQSKSGATAVDVRLACEQAGMNKLHLWGAEANIQALLGGGATVEQFGSMARRAAASGKGIAWVVAAVAGQMREAAKLGAELGEAKAAQDAALEQRRASDAARRAEQAADIDRRRALATNEGRAATEAKRAEALKRVDDLRKTLTTPPVLRKIGRET